MLVYGLNTCSICKKALKALEASNVAFEFRDVRDAPLNEAELAVLIAEFGDRLVDRTTNDWRGLSDWLKHSEVEDQLAAKPKLMARPVIQHEGTYYLGWDETVQKAVLSAQ
ncbi:MAG: arsenate reductase family protein [Shimia sp.]|jgi:arsenate reductase-like glutaredoxin family protein|uniref:arsenate reductase family protein n=1 Tax=Shimia sp. TaxID=1954381 RepID=UPI004058267D